MRASLPHIVLVDDEPALLALHLRLIQAMEIGEVKGVDSVDALMQYLAHSLKQGQAVDLILMDIMMPGTDGIEGCRLVHSQQAFQDIPIIMLTSMRDAHILESAFEQGAMDYVLKPFDEIELRARLRSALRLKAEIERRKARERDLLDLSQALIGKQIKTEETLYHDALTGIYNRRAFDKKLHDEWINCYVLQKCLALILFDIDFFKDYNDRNGHLAGDQCLQAVARSLPENNSGGFSARFGGEEFVVLLPGARLDEATARAEAIRTRIESLMLPHSGSRVGPYVTVSLGVSALNPAEYPKSDVLIQRADEAMYRAKQAGRNRVSL